MRSHQTKQPRARTIRSTLSVIDEVELAFNPQSRVANVLGFILGGVIPVATYLEAHVDLDPSRPLFAQPATFVVAGGLLFSAKTVFTWGRRLWDGWKAAGFVLLFEVAMVTSHVPVLPLVLLALLVGINGVATACTLSLDRASMKRARSPKGAARAQAALRTTPATTALATVAQPRSEATPTSRRRRTTAPQERFPFDIAS